MREREHEDEVEEELPWRDAVLVIDCRRGHRPRPYCHAGVVALSGAAAAPRFFFYGALGRRDCLETLVGNGLSALDRDAVGPGR